MIIIKKEDVPKIQKLFELAINDSYITLEEYNGYRTIVQYNEKYDDVHICSVNAETLDKHGKYQLYGVNE